MKIDRKLNLVVPLVRDADGADVFVHSTPVSADVFDKHYLVIGKAFAELYSSGLGPIAGPRIADKMLKKIAQTLGVWDTPDGVERTFVNEMRRLTMVVYPGERGWDSMLFDDACKAKIIEPTDEAEVMACLTFFTVSSLMHRRRDTALMEFGLSLWGARTESSSCTDFMRSLPTWIAAASSGGKAA